MARASTNSKDPIVFGDLRDLDAKERKRLEERHEALTVNIKKKRALTPQEKLELLEIEEKLKQTVVDPLFNAVTKGLKSSVDEHQGGLMPSQTSYPGRLTEPEKLVAGVCGLLEDNPEVPPPDHPDGVKPPFDPDEERRKQHFGRVLYSAQGEYETNQPLFDAVLKILIQIGSHSDQDEVKAIEWAQVVRKLIAKGVTENEPQLVRRVGEALDSVQNVGEDRPPSAITIDLPSLDDERDGETEIIPDNVRALQPTYLCAMLEEMKVFQVVDKLVELFQNGILPVGRGEAGNNLFKYWKETAIRISEAERRSCYARALGIPGGDDGDMPNREFNDLFLRFVSAVSSFVRQNSLDELLQTKIPGSISQQKVRKAGHDLAMNLSLHGYGMAYFIATDLQKQVADIIKLLSDPDIKNAYGCTNMWQVIEQVAALELGGAKNSVKYRTMATSGTIIFAWLAKHARELSNSSVTFGKILDVDEIRSPSPRPANTKSTTDPTDFDLVNACEQWLAVTGTQDDQVEGYAQPREAPNMTSKPIQIPDAVRAALEAEGVPAMSLNGGRRYQ